MKLTISERGVLLVVKFHNVYGMDVLNQGRADLIAALAAAKSRKLSTVILDLTGIQVNYEDVGLALLVLRQTELGVAVCGLNQHSQDKFKMLGISYLIEVPKFPDIESAIAALSEAA